MTRQVTASAAMTLAVLISSLEQVNRKQQLVTLNQNIIDFKGLI